MNVIFSLPPPLTSCLMHLICSATQYNVQPQNFDLYFCSLFQQFYTYFLITRWIRVCLEKLTGSQLVKNFPEVNGTECSLTPTQEPTTCPNSKLGSSRPSRFRKINSNPIYACVLQVVYFTQVSAPKPLYTSVFSPYVLHTPLFSFSLIWGENRSLSFSLYNFFHSPFYFILLRSKYSPQPSVFRTLSLLSSLKMIDQFHSHTKTGKIIFLCIFSVIFWIAEWKTKRLH